MEEPRTVSVSQRGKEVIERLSNAGHFEQGLDAYRFALALAIANEEEPHSRSADAETRYNVGSLDPDGSVYYAVVLAQPEAELPRYRAAEGYAEAGLELLRKRLDGDELLVGDLFEVGAESD